MAKEKEEKKKESSIYSFIEIFTHAIQKIVNDITKFIGKKENSNKVFVILKVLVLLILISLMKYPFRLIKGFGVMLIYMIGTTFREPLSGIWMSIVNYTYWLIGIILIYKSLKQIVKSEEFLEFFQGKDNTKKNKRLKSTTKILIKITRALTYISLLVLVTVAMLFTIFFVLLLFLATRGALLISAFLIIGSIITIFVSLFFLLHEFCFGKKKIGGWL